MDETDQAAIIAALMYGELDGLVSSWAHPEGRLYLASLTPALQMEVFSVAAEMEIDTNGPGWAEFFSAAAIFAFESEEREIAVKFLKSAQIAALLHSVIGVIWDHNKF